MSKISRNVRVRKLATRTPISIYREDEVESDEYEIALSQLAKVSTGVESNEETEYHLQAIISETLQKDKEIPTGEKARPSNIKYDELYPPNFKTSMQYIAFSQTVEDCTGCQYDMSSEDAEYLKKYNKGRSRSAQLSEDDFERIMAAFEEYAAIQTPFASVDKTVSPWTEIETYLKQELDEKTRTFGRDVYEYWRDRKQVSDRGHIQPSLKFETQQQETDDNDAYVCFRRREVRQTRKTRARDLQSTERLRNLRKNLEDGRNLVIMTLERDRMIQSLFEMDCKIFAQRAEVKDVKVMLGVKTDDEDLINQRPQKRKIVEAPQTHRPAPGSIKFPSRGDGRAFDAEFQMLSEVQAEQENIKEELVAKKQAENQAANRGWVDCTREPLSPVREQGVEGFRPATASYLMTPPASASEESTNENPSPTDESTAMVTAGLHASIASEDQRPQLIFPGYRRRWGRGNRLWIDRRGLPLPTKAIEPNEHSERIADRMKFDHDDHEEPPVYTIDPYSFERMKFRATIPIIQNPLTRRALPPGTGASPSSNRSASGSQRQPSQSIPNVT